MTFSVWVFKQIWEALKAVVKLVNSMIKWLFQYEDDSYKRVGGRRRVEELFRRAEQIEEEYQEVNSRLHNEKSVDQIKMITRTSQTLEDNFYETYGTQLDFDLIVGHTQGTNIEDLKSSLNAILAGMEAGVENMKLSVKSLEEIYNDKLYNNEITANIRNLRAYFYDDLDKDKSYYSILFPYSYTDTVNMIEVMGGKFPPNLSDIQRRQKEGNGECFWYLTDKQKQEDLFWEGRVATKNGGRVDPITWNGGDGGKLLCA